MNSEQIAKLAGVSRSTVSKVLHNYPDIPESTKQKVLKVIKEEGYRPNVASQILKGSLPNVINVYFYTSQDKNNGVLEMKTPYMMSVLAAITLEARKRHYSVLMDVIDARDDEQNIINMINDAFNRKRMAAAVFVGLTDDAHFLESIANNQRHIIVLDKKTDTATGIRCIFANDLNSGRRATEHLFDQGYKRVMHISGDLKKLSGRARKDGYLEAVDKYNQHHQNTACEPYVINAVYSYSAGYEAGRTFMKERLYEHYDAIVFGSDTIAHGFIAHLKETNAKILDTLGMIGFDNDPLNSYYKPALSSMAVDFDNLAHIIFNLEQNFEKFNGGMSLIVDHKLIERETSLTKDDRIALAQENTLRGVR